MARPIPLTYVPADHDAERLRVIYRRLLQAKRKAPATPLGPPSHPTKDYADDSLTI